VISVIIATRDRATMLRETLDALGAQEPPGCPVEVIVADNASMDDTRGVVADAARRLPFRLVYLREGRSGKSHALNAALAQSTGDILVFTDDDVLPGPGWLSAISRAFAETGADYIVGRILPLWEAPPPPWMSPALYGVLAVPDGGGARVGIEPIGDPAIMPLGANMAVRRRVIEAIGGWNPDLGKLQGTLRTGEDHEFARRMVTAGFLGAYEPVAVVQHRVSASRLRLSYFMRWFYDNGGIVAGLERQYPTTPHYLLRIPRHAWREWLTDLAAAGLALVRRDVRTLVASCARVLWFLGFARASLRLGPVSQRSSPRLRKVETT
jgi:glycosyltransferase involved in cell wall biosynthesis